MESPGSLERPRVEYRTPEDLVKEVQRGRIRIPMFQRGFKWESSDVLRLFDSIVRGFPVGNLLLWQRPAPARHLRVGPIEVDAPETESALWVIDGQQRIVSLVGALVAASETTDQRFRIFLDLDSGAFHSVGVRQFPPDSWIPVSELLDTATLLRWMRANAAWLTEKQIQLADSAAKAVREYQIPTYVVNSLSEEPLLEIFTRMNTTGKRLTKSEVFQALHTGAAAGEPADLHALGELSAEAGFGRMDDRLALRCVLAFRGGDIFREDFTDEFTSTDDQLRTFREVSVALNDAVSFLKGPAEIPHIKLLPYSHVLPALIRFIATHGVPDGRSATLLRRWVWRSAIAGTHARGISVPDIRQLLASVDTPGAVDAASALLRQTRSYPDFTPELDKTHFRHAMAKINVLGLLSAGPRDLQTGAPVDLVPLLEEGSPLRAVLPPSGGPLTQTMANRVVHGPAPARDLRSLLLDCPEDVAAGHAVDDRARELLADGRVQDFLEHRADLVGHAVVEMVSRMAEWGARDSRSMAEMLRAGTA